MRPAVRPVSESAPAGRTAVKASAQAMATTAPSAGSAVSSSGPSPGARPSESSPPATAMEPRKTEYSSTRKASSVRVAVRASSPARRKAQIVSAAPPTPPVGSRRVAAAPPRVTSVLARRPSRGVARLPTSHSSAT